MRNINNPSCIVSCSVTAAKPNLSTVIKLFSSGSGYHSHSFIIQIRLPETDGSLLSAYQSADPKHSITERIYHTHSGSSSASKCSAHIYAAQTPHATKPVEKNTSAGRKSSFSAGIVDPLQETLVLSDLPPNTKPGPHSSACCWAG